MKSDVIFNKDAYLQLKEAVDLICNAVKVTLGPRGKNVLTINSYGDAHLTKDGITVAKNVTSSDPIINGILNVVREASANTAKTAGDGPQPLYAEIMTPSGPIKLGDIKVGDIICGTGGTTQKVLGVFDKGILEVYEVTTSDGRKVQCSGNHLWSVKVHSGKEYTLTTEQLFKDYTKKKNGYNTYKYYIPNTFVSFDKKDFIISPYFLGVLLGDGCLRDSGSIEIQIGYSKKHILDKLNLPDWIQTSIQDVPLRKSLRVKFKGEDSNNKTLRDYLEELGLRNTTSKNKFIPTSYLYSSKEQRECLLQGLIDTDGHFSDKGLIQFSTVSEQLYKDVVSLMRSLGKTTYTDIRNNTPEKGCYSYSTVYRISELKGYKNGLKITNITKTGNFQPMRCIKVENNNHLYITNDFVSTHNTTTSLVLTQALFNEGLKLIENGCNPTLLKEGMNYALNDTLEYIETLSEKITIKDVDKLKNIATISAAMDESIADIALEAILESKGSGVIKIDESKTSNTTIKTDRGLTFANGYLTSHFLNTEKPIIEYSNPYIFVSNIELTNATLVTIMKHAKNSNRPLIVLAPEFNENITISMFKNFKSGAVQICPIKLPGFAGNRAQWIDDITAYIEGEVYTSNNIDPIKYLGDAEKIIISQDETSIINTEVKLSCSSQLCKLEARLSEDIEDWQKEDIKSRLARLRGLVVTIFVGATTELELKEKKDRVEDAVCALQTALKGGISEGGGMTFMRVYNALENKEKSSGYNAVITSLAAPFIQLCDNSDMVLTRPTRDGYNFKTNVWEDLKEAGIIDPTLVLKNAITNAVGIVSNLLMTECITYHE